MFSTGLLMAFVLLCAVLICGGCARLAGGLLAVSIALSASVCQAVDVSPIARRNCQNGACALESRPTSVAAIAQRQKPATAAAAKLPAMAMTAAPPVSYAVPTCIGNQCYAPQRVTWSMRRR